MTSLTVVCLVTALAPSTAAGDAGAAALEQQRLQRQQQQEALQLRMQQDNAVRSAPGNAQDRRAIERSHTRQRQKQEAVHDRQARERTLAQPTDDKGTREAKEIMRRQAAARDGVDEVRQPAGTAGGTERGTAYPDGPDSGALSGRR